MSWFTLCKSNYERVMEEQAEEQWKLEDKVFAKHPLRSIVEYMGVSCTVTAHKRHRACFPAHGLPTRPAQQACIECDYVDKVGVIHQISFALEEFADD